MLDTRGHELARVQAGCGRRLLADRPRILAVSRIAEQFGGAGRPNGFPTLEGWCCTAVGDAV